MVQAQVLLQSIANSVTNSMLESFLVRFFINGHTEPFSSRHHAGKQLGQVRASQDGMETRKLVMCEGTGGGYLRKRIYGMSLMTVTRHMQSSDLRMSSVRDQVVLCGGE